MIRDNFYCYS